MERLRGASAAPEAESAGAGESCLVPRAFKRSQGCSTRSPCPAPGQHRRTPERPLGSSAGVWLLQAAPCPRLRSQGWGHAGSSQRPAPHRGSRPSRCRGGAHGPCASCGSCTGPCCSSRGLSVLGGSGGGAGLCEGVLGSWRREKARLSSQLEGSFPSFSAGIERRARKEPRDAVSCRDTSHRQERPCPSGKSWQSQAWEQGGCGGPPGADPHPAVADGPLTCSTGSPGSARAAARRGFIRRGGVSGSSLRASRGVVQGVSFGSLALGQRGAGKRLLPGHIDSSPSSPARHGTAESGHLDTEPRPAPARVTPWWGLHCFPAAPGLWS